MIEEEKMINSSEQVFEVDCDLDTLVLCCKTTQIGLRKLVRLAKSEIFVQNTFRVKKLFFPAQMIMSSPNSFRVKGQIS